MNTGPAYPIKSPPTIIHLTPRRLQAKKLTSYLVSADKNLGAGRVVSRLYAAKVETLPQLQSMECNLSLKIRAPDESPSRSLKVCRTFSRSDH